MRMPRTYQATAVRVDRDYTRDRGRLGAPLNTVSSGRKIVPSADGLDLVVADADLGDRLRVRIT